MMKEKLDDCYNWLLKFKPCNQAINAEQIASNFIMYNKKKYEFQNINELTFAIEQDDRFDRYILKGNDETFEEEEEMTDGE